MAWFRIDPLDLPACLQSREFDCQVCTFSEPEECALRADGEYMEAERAQLRRRVATGNEREQWGDVLAIELAAHGLSLHYTMLARIVRERYRHPSLSDMRVLRTLSGSLDYFEVEEPGVYGLTRVGRNRARLAAGSRVAPAAAPVTRRHLRTALDFFFATATSGSGILPAQTHRQAWTVQEWRAVAASTGQEMPALCPPAGGLQVLEQCEEHLRRLVISLLPLLRTVAAASWRPTLRIAAARYQSLDAALVGTFGVPNHLLAKQIREAPDSAWLTSRALYRVVARVYRAWQVPAVHDVEVESLRDSILQLTESLDSACGDAALADYVAALYSAGVEARNCLAVANLRLVSHIAYRYRGRSIGIADLIAYGTLGLLIAAERFDPTRGFTFGTYAYQWIRQAIARAIADSSRAIRLPVHVVEFLTQVDRGEEEFAAELSCDPTVEELADYLGIQSEQIEIARRARRPILSLDDPSNSAEAAIIDDIVDESEDADPQEQAERRALETCLVRAFHDDLTPREGLVLKHRFGLVDHDPQTRDQIADRFGVSRERIRQIEVGALEKLRRYSSLRAELEDFVVQQAA